MPVETDVNKLVTYCCGLNYLKTGGEEVKLKADSEYPEWLWKLPLDGGPTEEEQDPENIKYWLRKRRIAIAHQQKSLKNKYPEPFIPKRIKNLRLA